MSNFNSFIQRLPSCQSTDEPTRKSISGAVRVDDLFVLESIYGICLEVVRITGGNGDGFFSTMRKYDNTVTTWVGFWVFGKCLGNGGKVLGVRKAVRASPSLGFGLVTDEVVNVWKDYLELSTEKLSDEGSGEVEDEYLGKSSASARIQRNLFSKRHTFPFSDAFLLISTTESVPWVRK